MLNRFGIGTISDHGNEKEGPGCGQAGTEGREEERSRSYAEIDSRAQVRNCSEGGAGKMEQRWKDLNARIMELFARGKYAAAVVLAKEAVCLAEATAGAENPVMAASLCNLAGLYIAQRRYVDAEPLFHRSLAICEEAFGPDPPDVAACMKLLAHLYRHQSRNDEAELVYRRSLALYEKALGPDHPDVAKTLNDLAELYSYQGRYAEAEPLFRRSLSIEEKNCEQTNKSAP